MSTRGGQPAADAGREYWQHTFDDLAVAIGGRQSEFNNPDEPPKFKAYRGQPRFPLPVTAPHDGFRPPTADTGRPARLTEEHLSELLYYTFGILSHEFGAQGTWPHHRTVASARCLFPTQLYLWLPDTGSIPAGCYHYDPAHHTLVGIRVGDHRHILSSALDVSVRGASAVLVLSSRYWHNAYIYRDYAYRLCNQEAGLVAGNAQLVFGTQGYHCPLHHEFLDAPLNELFGIDPDEEPAVAVLPVYADGPPVEGKRWATTSDRVLRGIPAISPPSRASGRMSGACPRVTALDHASRITSTASIANPSALAPPRWTGTGASLAQALRRRTSGPSVFDPIAGPIGADAVRRIAAHASDHGAPIDVYVTIRDVSELTPGIYKLGSAGALDPVAPLPDLAELAGSCAPPAGPYPPPNIATTNVLVHLVGDRDRALARHGSRSYRIVNQRAGVVAQHISLLAAVDSLAARITNSYDVRRVRALLRLDRAGELPIFQILIGATRPPSRYTSRLTF
jgi:SagB-type dehydrogenase family enzyme